MVTESSLKEPGRSCQTTAATPLAWAANGDDGRPDGPRPASIEAFGSAVTVTVVMPPDVR